MKHFNKKIPYKGEKYDSQKELDFFIRFVENSGKRYKLHPSYKVLDGFRLGGYNQRGISYAPDFVVYGDDGEVEHVYDVKTSLSLKGIVGASKLRMILFQYRYRIPVEIVTPRKYDFKMRLLNFTVNKMLDDHPKKVKVKQGKDKGKVKTKHNYHNVYKDIYYDIKEIVGY